jgi:transcription initiation factor TFIIF subunit alpha
MADEPPSLASTDLPYQEFRLMSCDRHGWKYDVMKFDYRKPVDIQSWTKPVRLNRKELRRENATGQDADAEANVPKAVGPMLGLDGKPVIGIDGRVVMVDADGRPIHNTPNGSQSSTGTSTPAGKSQPDKPGDKPSFKKSKKFQKKTRQVFLVPDHIRQLRREERHPWVIEDSATPQKETWVGRMEEASKSETHALFMPAADNVFKFVPAHRWYKFQKRSARAAISLEEAEKLVSWRFVLFFFLLAIEFGVRWSV